MSHADESTADDDLAASDTDRVAAGSDAEGRVGGAAHDGFVAVRLLWAFVRAPWVLVYPPLVLLAILVGLVVPPALVGLLAAYLDPGRSSC